ncbi:MAG: UUP1 family membrane protein, partial [Pseudomonadota bacterium]
MSGNAETLNKVHVYVLALFLTAVGLGIFFYKAFALGFPLTPDATTEVWNVESRIRFVADGKPVKVSMMIPGSSNRFAVVDEHFISGGLGLVTGRDEGNRTASWSIREAWGKQSVFYQAVVKRTRSKQAVPDTRSPEIQVPTLDGRRLQAAEAVAQEIKAKS